MMHEFSHVHFAGEGASGCNIASVLCYADSQRFLWNNDLTTMREDCGCGAEEYHQSAGRPIRHQVSTDGGVTWSPENDNLSESTNLTVGVDYGVTSYSGYNYLLAFVEPDGTNAITIAIGNGTSWISKWTTAWATETGLSVAYGNGQWVVAWANPDSGSTVDRHIFWMTSTNGTTWTWPQDLNSTFTHGSLTGPSVEYDSTSGRFILAFTNWMNWDEGPCSDGQLVTCTSSNPASVPFANCDCLLAAVAGRSGDVNVLPYPIEAPAIACRGGGVQYCSITMPEVVGPNDNQLLNTCAQIVAGEAQFSTITPATGGYSSRSVVSSAVGGGIYVLAFRGQDGATLINTARKTSACTSWGGKSVWSTSANGFGPTLVFGNGKFSLYYGN